MCEQDQQQSEPSHFCFLCLLPINLTDLNLTSPAQSPSSSSSSVCIQSLVEYLKVNWSNVFPLKGATLNEFVAKVLLCPVCSSLNEQFTQLYKKEEFCQFELLKLARQIKQRLDKTEDIDREKLFQKKIGSAEEKDLSGKFKLLKNVRQQLIQKVKKIAAESTQRSKLNPSENEEGENPLALEFTCLSIFLHLS